MSMFEKDWFMRQITSITKMIAVGVLHKANPTYEIEDEDHLSEPDLLHKLLMEHLGNFRVKEAQKILYDAMVTTDVEYLKVAIDFYDRLGSMSDEEREKAGVSIVDIQAGLDAITKNYGIYL